MNFCVILRRNQTQKEKQMRLVLTLLAFSQACINSYSFQTMHYPTPYYVIIITESLTEIFVRLMNLELNESWYVPYLGPV